MAEPVSIKALQDAALDRAYLQAAGPLLNQVRAITNATNSQMQRSLKDLDDEARRLKEADEKMKRELVIIEATKKEKPNEEDVAANEPAAE